MQSVLVTGCNRGIGLGLIKRLVSLPQPPANIIATCRNQGNAPELTQLANQHPQVKIIEIDLTNFGKYGEVVDQIDKIVADRGLNLLVNNAGISTKFTRINLVKVEQLLDNFVINTAAPIMLTKALLLLLKKASQANQSLPIGINRAAVVNISSVLGSIGANNQGGFYPYRCSKSALNAATKSLAMDLKPDGIMAIAVHPGWCKTDMGGKEAPLEVDKMTLKFLECLQNLKPEQTGSFIQYDGKAMSF